MPSPSTGLPTPDGPGSVWLAEQAPEEMLAALTTFLAPYRDGESAAHDAGPQAAGGR